MIKKRIKELADFFYSSNSSNDVPLRIAVTSGQYWGNDLNYTQFIELFEILSHSKTLKSDLYKFWNEINKDE